MKLQNSKLNPFTLSQDHDIRADINDIDADNNELLRSINEGNCQYYIEDSFNNLLDRNKHNNQFSLLHFNVRSSRNKHDELSNSLNSLHLTFSIIGLTETWLTDDCPMTYRPTI